MAVTNKRGIFSLLDVRERQSAGVWSLRSDVWITQGSGYRQTHPFGYFAGGDGSGGTQIERVSFNNDTANCIFRANCPRTFEHDAAGNETFMYYGGGAYMSGGFVKYHYGNDTANTVPGGLFSTPRRATAAVSNSNYTYFAGGRNPSYTPTSSVDRIDTSNDTVTSINPMSLARYDHAATGNQNYGYIHGGEPSRSNMDRIDYSSETFLTPAIGPTGYSQSEHCGFGNADKGYFANGGAVKGFDYSNDTASFVTKGSLLFGVDSWPGATGNSSFAYICGKRVSPTTNLNRFDYSNDTATATAAGNTVYNRNYPAAASPQEHGMTGLTVFAPAFRVDWQYGYGAGGYTSNSVSTVHRIDFSNDNVLTSQRSALPAGAYASGAVGNRNYGYVGGGDLGGPDSSIVYRIDYANDTSSPVAKGPLDSPKQWLGTAGNANFGYWAGGGTPSPSSSSSRIDYSNDTATTSPKGVLSQSRTEAGATGNANYGWWGGGYTTGQVSTVDRLDYSSDTTTAAPKGPLSAVKQSHHNSAAGNANYGWWVGGYSGSSRVTTVDRVDYSNDTATASVRGPLTTQTYEMGGQANSSFGYWAGGGTSGGNLSTIQRVDFSNDTATPSPRSNLTVATTSLASISAKDYALGGTTPLPASSPINYATNKVSYPYGYTGGGYNSPPTVGVSSIERLDFSNDTASLSVRGNFVATRKQLAGGVSNENFGYTLAGYDGSGPTTNTERLDYSNDTGAILTKGDISQQIEAGAPLSGNGYGYLCGGTNPSPPTTDRIERLDFSNDTTNTVQRTLSSQKTNAAGVGNRDYGYVVGGYLAPNRNSTIERIDYSNDLPGGNPRALLPSPLSESSAIGNANYGYAVGGYDGSYTSKIFRIDYANDTSTAPHRTNMIFAANRMGVNGNNDFGYVYGSPLPTVRSTVQRIDYSNDTATALYRGGMGTPRGETQGFSSRMMGLSQPPVANVTTPYYPIPLFGYFIAGSTGSSRTYVDRINYANDTATATFRGPLTVATAQAAATGNTSFGYVCQGYPNGTNIQRIEYANDTATASYKGRTNSSRTYLAAAGNQSYGWFAGGDTAVSFTYSSSVDRHDFSNDTATTALRGPLSSARYKLSATGNQNFGYWAGGQTQEGPGIPRVSYSTIDRIDYSNDSVAASPRGPFPAPTNQKSGTGNADFGYFASGGTVLRVDYSNDSVAATPKGAMRTTRYGMGATGNKDFGYFGSGEYPESAQVERIEYANDTATALIKGPLAASRRQIAACSPAANALPQ